MMGDAEAVPGDGEVMPGYQTGQADPEYQIADTAQLCARILAEVEQVIVGKREPVRMVLLGILASGHMLIEDLPGLGKTLLARTFAAALGLRFTRVQFTPDMLPSDLTGHRSGPARAGSSRSGPGRCSPTCCSPTRSTAPRPRPRPRCWRRWPRARSAWTAPPTCWPRRSWCCATDNPIEYEGTYPLPEAQLDRFTARVRLGYLDHDGEAEMVRRRLERGSAALQPRQVTDAAGVLAMRESLEAVHLDPDVLGYIVKLVAATREHPKVMVGASPRGRSPSSSWPGARGAGRPGVRGAGGRQGGRGGRARAPARAPPGDVGTADQREDVVAEILELLRALSASRWPLGSQPLLKARRGSPGERHQVSG